MQSLLLPVKDTMKSKCYERSNLRALNNLIIRAIVFQDNARKV